MIVFFTETRSGSRATILNDLRNGSQFGCHGRQTGTQNRRWSLLLRIFSPRLLVLPTFCALTPSSPGKGQNPVKRSTNIGYIGYNSNSSGELHFVAVFVQSIIAQTSPFQRTCFSNVSGSFTLSIFHLAETNFFVGTFSRNLVAFLKLQAGRFFFGDDIS